MDKSKIIKKDLSKLKVKPNMADYDLACSNYSLLTWKREIAYFEDGKLNAAYDAIDKHIKTARKNRVALYWEGKDGEEKKYTFLELSLQSNRFGNLLKSYGIGRGDRVFFFLPRIPEIFIGFLGVLKIGAIAGTLFSAFGESALLDRLANSDASVLVTTYELSQRLKNILKDLPNLKRLILVDRGNRLFFNEEKPLKKNKAVSLGNKKVSWFYEQMVEADDQLRIAHMDENDPAFMLYTSGTTGKPKGVVHAHRAIIHEHMSAKFVLDLRQDDIYWCTADPGWVTGIAYEIMGNWSCGASTLVYEGRFDPEKWYSLIDEYKVTVWYTAPTAIRLLAAEGLDKVKKYDLTSLRHLASVGEPLNPEAVYWGLKAFGLPFHDNFWQTETGGMTIANYPSMDIKPGSMGRPLPGITAAVVDDQGQELGPNVEGNLALKPGWPSMMLKIWRRPKKYESYFVGGWYITGDRAFMDEDGYVWFVGRADDVIKTSGERVGPFEVESALVEHPDIVEAGVIGKPDKIRGEIIKAFVVLRPGVKESKDFYEKIKEYMKKKLAGHAYPRELEVRDKLPKTRSGKIMRRLLKAQELGLPLGDTSTVVY